MASESPVEWTTKAEVEASLAELLRAVGNPTIDVAIARARSWLALYAKLEAFHVLLGVKDRMNEELRRELAEARDMIEQLRDEASFGDGRQSDGP